MLQQISEEDALVLGAGIQGVCIALMLAKRGINVKLVDRCDDIITQASLNYEGRIHLGFIYARDFTIKTGSKLIKDALHFAPYIDHLLGTAIDWPTISSTPNHYLVAKDSLLNAEKLEEYYRQLDKVYQSEITNVNLNYLGQFPDSLFQRCSVPNTFDKGAINAAFLTQERSIDQVAIKGILKAHLENCENIELVLKHSISKIIRTSNGYRVKFAGTNDIADLHSKFIFNCLWENRGHFDRSLCMPLIKEDSVRLKYGLLVKKDDFIKLIPSFSVTHGAYGSLVNIPSIDHIFISWYDACLVGMVPDENFPYEWREICDGEIHQNDLKQIQLGNLQGFQSILPGLKSFDFIGAKAGLILADGQRDIHDPTSNLHKRAINPIRIRDGYFSINTSKYTSAPHNTLLLEKLIFGNSDFK